MKASEHEMMLADLTHQRDLLLAACEECLLIARIPRPSAQAQALDRAEPMLRAAIAAARGDAIAELQTGPFADLPPLVDDRPT